MRGQTENGEAEKLITGSHYTTPEIQRAQDHLGISGKMKVWSSCLCIPTSNAPRIRVVRIQYDAIHCREVSATCR